MDVKPYIRYCDTPFDDVRQAAWLDAPPRSALDVLFSEEAEAGLAHAAADGSLRHLDGAEGARRVIEAVMKNGGARAF